MATHPNTTPDWFREFFEGRSDEEIDRFKRIAEALVAPIEPFDEPAAPPSPDPELTEGLRRFALAYSDWLRARALGHDPRTSEDEVDNAIDRETEAVSRLIGERAWYQHHIWQKLSLLDFYLGDCEDSWTDRRCARLLASIKSDLRTHGIGTACR